MNQADGAKSTEKMLAPVLGDTLRSAGARRLLYETFDYLIVQWASSGSRGKKAVASVLRRFAGRLLKPRAAQTADERVAAVWGTFFTEYAKKRNEERPLKADCKTAACGKALSEFLDKTDFGEISEMAEDSRACLIAGLKECNEQLWKHPAKVASILSIALSLTNTGVKTSATLLEPVEKNIGPDLLADLLLSLVRGLDAREAAELFNLLNEMINRFHTGNLLLSKADKPLLQKYLNSLLEEGLPSVNPTLLRKARVALAENREAARVALYDTLQKNPQLVLEMVRAYGSLKTPQIRAFSRRVTLLAEQDRDSFSDAAAQGISALDVYEIAAAFNALFRVVNALHDARPDVVSSFLTGVCDSLDIEEIKTTIAWLVPEAVEAMRPLFEAVLPSAGHAPDAGGEP